MDIPIEKQKAQVIARFGQTCRINDPSKGVIDCFIKKSITPPVAGDWVEWQQEANNLGKVIDVHPRTTVLERQDKTGQCKPLAANIDQLFIVSAFSEPSISDAVIDGYLVVAENEGMTPILIFNKGDLAANDSLLVEHKKTYLKLDYQCIECSALTGEGIADIQQCLPNKTSILVGQSGVGKSTIINQIIPDAEIATLPLSVGINQGQHTTTASTLYSIGAVDSTGKLIDSPGIRRFTPYIKDRHYLDKGFKEIYSLSEQCQFSNCAHDKEPHCAIKQAIDHGSLSEKRLENYFKLALKIQKP